VLGLGCKGLAGYRRKQICGGGAGCDWQPEKTAAQSTSAVTQVTGRLATPREPPSESECARAMELAAYVRLFDSRRAQLLR
jgi:hypothetical protein